MGANEGSSPEPAGAYQAPAGRYGDYSQSWRELILMIGRSDS